MPTIRSEKDEDGTIRCSRSCENLGIAHHLNTRAYCSLYRKWLSGSFFGERPPKACTDCKECVTD
jgi:hypothetical protein